MADDKKKRSERILKEICAHGMDVDLTAGVTKKLLWELLEIAKTSGSRITLSTRIGYDVINEIATLNEIDHRKQVAFVHCKKKYP